MNNFQRSMGVVLVTGLFSGNLIARETIVIGDQAWEGAHAISNVLKVVIEEKLDATVRIVNSDQNIVFAGMDRGDGSMDVLPDLWIPNSKSLWDAYIAPGSKASVTVNDKPYIGNQGMYVPGYVQDKYGIKSVEQLADPEIAKLFDINGTGKARWWAGAPGWNVTKVEQVRAKSYGYDKTFKPLVISDEAFRSELELTLAVEEPVVFYYWEPEGLFKKYDFRKLDEPSYNESCYKMVTPEESSDWKEKSSVKCGYPPATVYVAYSKSLHKRAPKVAQFLKQVNFNIPTLNEWILHLNEKEDPYEVAKKWVAVHPEIVKEWVKGI